MSFVDAIEDKNNSKIKVVERVNGKRVYKEYPTEYVFFYEDLTGTYRSMRGDILKRIRTRDKRKYTKELRDARDAGKIIHESDINPVYRCLSENYYKKDAPKLNIGFFDIETDYDDDKGYGKPWDTHQRITAMIVYLTSTKTLHTFALKPEYKKGDPREISWDEADAICNEFENTHLCDSEEQMLECFLEIIEDVDLLSGWNSTEYDIPYIINRMIMVLGKDRIKDICLWDKAPKVREYTNKWGQPMKTYDTVGRVHLDLLEIYKKHAGKELPTYKLDYVGEIELGENKVAYEGKIDDMYKGDFRKFIEYARQDVILLVKLEEKLKYLDLANQIAHMNTVPIQKTMGSVALIEQGVVNKAWELGLIVPEKKKKDVFIGEDGEELDYEEPEDPDEKAAVGAYVRDPVPGIYKMVAAVDINSLYPSTLRALNIGPETIVAQIRPTYTEKLLDERRARGIKGKDLWLNTFAAVEYDLVRARTDDILTIEYEEDGSVEEMTAKELHDKIYTKNSGYILSANGTIFDADRKCVVAELLTTWYNERKEMQGLQKSWGSLARGIKIPEGFLD